VPPVIRLTGVHGHGAEVVGLACEHQVTAAACSGGGGQRPARRQSTDCVCVRMLVLLHARAGKRKGQPCPTCQTARAACP
jgi:hypothetical protein